MRFPTYPKVLIERKKTRFSFWIGLVLFAAGFILTVISLNIYNPAIVPTNLRILSINKSLNIVVLGCDEIFNDTYNGKLLWTGRADAIAIINCNPFKNTLNILNIPRDTKIKVPDHGIEKINYLNTIGGPAFTKKYLEKLLNIKIDNFVIINVKGLNKIVDELGGIVLNVPQRMQYNDYAGMLYINLFPGKQLLNSEDLVGFLRYRHDSLGDIGRIQRQQEFIRALFQKLLDPIVFTKLPEIVSIYKKTVVTDLTPTEIIKVANFIRNVPHSKLKLVILPGEFGQNEQISYWIPDKKEITKVVKKLFYGKEDFFRFMRSTPKEIKVSVFNGSKKNKMLATKIANILREYGYTVITVQDSETNVNKTRIYAQKINPENALQVKYDLGNIGELIIGNYGTPESDVTILAGDDLVNLKPRRKKT